MPKKRIEIPAETEFDVPALDAVESAPAQRAAVPIAPTAPIARTATQSQDIGAQLKEAFAELARANALPENTRAERIVKAEAIAVAGRRAHELQQGLPTIEARMTPRDSVTEQQTRLDRLAKLQASIKR